MNFPTIRIEGSILSPDILDKIEQSDITGQLPKDFGFDSKIKVKDEIARAWADANSQWKIYKSRIENLKESESGNSETRKFWIIPLLGFLGYDVEFSKSSETVNGKTYAISHRAGNIDNFPIHIMGFKDFLDKKRADSGPRMSPHSLIQEYINLTEHLYAIVTNGFSLRLLRDSSRLIKLSYIEFDLEKMFEEEHYADFALLYRLLHSSRMPKTKDLGPESIIEKYHQDALDSGARIRDGLCNAVENSIRILGNGFLNNKSNSNLKDAFDNDALSPDEYHKDILRLIYRLLFLMVIEERGLIFPEKEDLKKKKIYYYYYSVSCLRNLCDKRFILNENYNNYWIQLKNTFKLFESEHYGRALGIKPLGGDLFNYDAIGVLNDCDLDNNILMQCFRNLNFYESEITNQVLKVNYAALNVEEFGSVYEGLLEYQPVIRKMNGNYEYALEKGNERSSSGSHYTPDELVQPLIKHSLDYIIEDKLKEKEPERALLSITVCDVACGSGHILLNAARRIAVELAKIRTGEDQPSPSSFRHAIKDVIKSCVYGVDKNPLAVELCKIALWLESHNPGEPLNFLDHKIKCGDSIVGLAHKEELLNGIPTEAFNKMPKDDKDICSELKKKNKKEIDTRVRKKQVTIDFQTNLNKGIKEISENLFDIINLPETTPEEVEAKRLRYLELNTGADWWHLKNLADIQVSQFFIPKTKENADNLVTAAKYFSLMTQKQILGGFLYKATSLSQERKFFHWFLEFPEIFEKGGFNCIIGNPPYLGDKKLKKALGERYLEYIKYYYSIGITDLIVYFLNRIYKLTHKEAYQSIITTSSISQGDLRIGALENIIKQNAKIIFAIKSVRWPGVANLNVALLSIKKGPISKETILLNGKIESNISSFLLPEEQTIEPYLIQKNNDKMFTGYYFLGDGFLLSNKMAEDIINMDKKYQNVIYPFINGDDINDSAELRNSRSIINFYDWSIDKEYDSRLKKPRGAPYANDYPKCLDIIENLVKPERLRWKKDKMGNDIIGEYALDKTYREKWWLFARSRPELREAIKNLKFIFATAQTTKYLNFVKLPITMAVSQTAYVLASDKFSEFTILQSNIHFEWALKFGNFKGYTYRYAPVSTFGTFPFPYSHEKLESFGKYFYNYRESVMLKFKLGLTKLYNLFHSKLIDENNDLTMDKQIKSLRNHLEVNNINISIQESIRSIFDLRKLHNKLDNEVLGTYGWSDIDLRHDFYEVDYLPENDRIRYTIHSDARKEILKRLLELNHKIHDEEVKAGLWDKKSKTKTDKSKEKKLLSDHVSDGTGSLFE